MVAPLLTELAKAGVKLRLADDGQLEVSAPKGRLSDELRAAIVEHKAELVEWLSSDRTEDGPAELPTIVPDTENLYRPFQPSDLQTSFLIGSREGLEYHVRPHQYMELDLDELDPARFEAALNRALRSQHKNIVVVREDMLLETVRDPAPVRVTVSDLRNSPDEEVQAEIDRVRSEMHRKELPLDRWPWLEAHVCRYGQGRARLHYNNNNFFCDAPATGAFLNSVMHFYHQPDDASAPPEVSYRDCVLALDALEESPLGQKSKKYWCDRMADWPEAPDLPLVGGADARERSRLERRELLIPTQEWAAVQDAAKQRGLTPTNVLSSVYAEVIAYWSGSRHFLLNNMMTHRLPLHPQINEVLGNFASLYPLEVDWRHDEAFQDRVRRLQNQVLSDMEHVYWSGVKVLQTLNLVRRTPGRAACPFAVGSALFVGQADRPVYSVLETPQVLLDCEFWQQRDGSLWVVWDVIESMFPDGLIDDMLAGYRSVLAQLSDGDRAWERTAFDLLPATQREQRALLNRSRQPEPDGLLHDALPGRAKESGSKPAVTTADSTLSYAELNRRADALAVQLTDEGLAPGDRVAVVHPKGCQQVTAVFAALAADAVYVPIDPDWPNERIRFLLEDASVRAVLTSEELRSELVALTDVPVLPVDGPLVDTAGAQRTPAARQPADLAYVIYTSGSTGRPKGAMLDHRGPLNTITDINRRFDISSEDVVFGVSSLCFDLSVYDLFGTVAAGATLVLPTAEQDTPASWLEILVEREVTLWNSVPVIMQLLVEEAWSASVQLPSLRTVLLSGDRIPVNLPERIRSVAPNARIISLGGATEASIWSICFPIDHQDPDWASIPYGKPLDNQTWYVFDEVGRDAPTWVPGHLHIGGSGVALGYLNDPARTEAAFVPHPQTGERLYRTGDLGRYLPGGDIEFLGRMDFQVKIQGFRVEPGEIEQVLLEHPDVDDAVVVARATGSGSQLAAFVVGERTRPTESVLRTFLAERLPGYLVPNYLTVLDRLPLTGNGKLDRRALEALEPAAQHQERACTAPPKTSTETMLVGIWKEVLSTDPVGIQDDFFDLGGQSFAALRVVNLLAQRSGRRVPVGALLRYRTIEALARWLDAAEHRWSSLVALRDAADQRPVFFVHPSGGNVLCYRGLAESMDRPLQAFQAPSPDRGLQSLDSVTDFAQEYLGDLLESQPHGPYVLGGWSSGAVVAFELAHLLEQRGETVEQLVIVDAPAPLVPRPVEDTQALLWFLEDLDIGFDPDQVEEGQRRELAEALEQERLDLALALVRSQGLRETGLDPAELASTFAVFRRVVSACNSYRAPEIAADLLVLRAQDGRVSEFADHPRADSPDWGWSALTVGTVTAATVPGTHHTLLDQGRVNAVAEAIDQRLHGSPHADGPGKTGGSRRDQRTS